MLSIYGCQVREAVVVSHFLSLDVGHGCGGSNCFQSIRLALVQFPDLFPTPRFTLSQRHGLDQSLRSLTHTTHTHSSHAPRPTKMMLATTKLSRFPLCLAQHLQAQKRSTKLNHAKHRYRHDFYSLAHYESQALKTLLLQALLNLHSRKSEKSRRRSTHNSEALNSQAWGFMTAGLSNTGDRGSNTSAHVFAR